MATSQQGTRLYTPADVDTLLPVTVSKVDVTTIDLTKYRRQGERYIHNETGAVINATTGEFIGWTASCGCTGK